MGAPLDYDQRESPKNQMPPKMKCLSLPRKASSRRSKEVPKHSRTAQDLPRTRPKSAKNTPGPPRTNPKNAQDRLRKPQDFSKTAQEPS